MKWHKRSSQADLQGADPCSTTTSAEQAGSPQLLGEAGSLVPPALAMQLARGSHKGRAAEAKYHLQLQLYLVQQHKG
eukprot:2547828-Amphidinium_carterae.2